MSNLYATEPATNGKVIFDTTAGEIEVELWGKEAPRAVRNFLALTMEGYYDGVIFHRIVPGFIIQSGDPTGTGKGGESFYGEPFSTEIHPRLKFNRRGLLGMANNGSKHTNTSQFFFTLDKADELTNKHTLFGKIVGNTIYNVTNMGNIDIDEEERPLVPPKIRGIRIIENPFDDIVPRITAAERRAQQQARIEAKREMEVREKRSKAKKNTGLLSFGDLEEIPEEKITMKKKGMTRQDLLDPEAAPASKPTPTFVDIPESLKDMGSTKEKEKHAEKKAAVDLKEIRAQHERDKAGSSAARQAEIKRMEADLRQLKKRTGNASDSDSDSEGRSKRRKGPSVLEEELSKYSRGRGRAAAKGSRRGKRDEEDDLLKELNRFSSRVAKAEVSDGEDAERAETTQGEGRITAGDSEEDLEVDDDVGWMKHKLKFVVDEKELTRRAEEEYAVIDPRAKARQLAEDERRTKDGHRKGMRTAGDVGRHRR